MSGYQGLPSPQPQQQQQQHYDGLEVDMRNNNAAEGLQAVPVQPDHAAPQLVAYADDDPAGKNGAGVHVAAYHDGASPLSQPYEAGQYYFKAEQPGQQPPGPDAVAGAAPEKKRRVRPLWLALGVVGLLVVVGAVVGGVVGSMAARNKAHDDNNDGGASSSSSSSPSSSSSNTTVPATTAALKNLRPGSRLGATGWRDGSNFQLRLFYQGAADNRLRASYYDSAASSWADAVVLDAIAYEPAAGTGIAAATTVENLKNPETSVFFLDGGTTMRQHVFQAQQPAGSPGSNGTWLNGAGLTAAPTSRLSAYWPFLLSQGSDGDLQWARADEGTWKPQDIPELVASPAAGLVAVSAKALYVEGGAILYRRSDGKLFNYLAEEKGNNTGTAWSTGNLARFTIPAASPLAAFTLARSSSQTDNDVNTYILYQDDAGALQMVWQDDDSDWKGPETYDAFAGADKGTDVACVTAAAWNGVGVNLTPNADLSRCYFQVKGRLREVQWTGSTWKSLGFLPIE